MAVHADGRAGACQRAADWTQKFIVAGYIVLLLILSLRCCWSTNTGLYQRRQNDDLQPIGVCRRQGTFKLRTHNVIKEGNFQLFKTTNHAKVLWDPRSKPKGLLMGHLNISKIKYHLNSVASKTEQLEQLLTNSNLDLLVGNMVDRIINKHRILGFRI